MANFDREKLRQRFSQYPGATPDSIDEVLEAYEARVEEKAVLIKQGFSNAGAEHYLDRKGYPRPPGWHSVFFYPGSMRPRNRYLAFAFLAVIIIIVIVH